MALINATAIHNADDYELEQSLKFNDNDSAYLSWTPASAGNRRTWTASAWVKRSSLGSIQYIWACTHTDDAIDLGSYFGSNDRLYVTDGIQGGGVLQTTQVFRDTSAWLHIVWALDTTQSTVNNRIKIYVNGVQVTDFANNAISSGISQNEEMAWMSADKEHRIGRRPLNNSSYLDGYIAEFNFVDGLVKAPADFGETGDYGEWKPVEYSGTYGTNGFYLNFAGGGVISSATGGTITTDGDYKVHSFTSNGTFTPSADGYVEYLVIAGGGGGGSASDDNGYSSGGGGAGGYRTGMLSVTAQGYSITVGAGGAGGINGSGEGSNGTQGANSVFSTITSIGGGYGATANQNGGAGGSGGGAAVGYGDNARSGGSATSGQGYAGGGGLAKNNGGRRDPSGGGGGAGQVGYTGSGSTGGNGGNGLASSITGSSVTRAGGGAGDAQTGGSGGGGSGRNNGTANTGSGGGGSSNGTNHGGADGHNYGDGGSGGSGIVIIRYKFQ